MEQPYLASTMEQPYLASQLYLKFILEFTRKQKIVWIQPSWRYTVVFVSVMCYLSFHVTYYIGSCDSITIPELQYDRTKEAMIHRKW